MTFPPTSITYVGNFISSRTGARQFCEDLTARLEEAGLRVNRASRRVSPIPRLVEMVFGAARGGRRGGIVVVDVFSTRGFLWAELSSVAARLAGGKVIAVLHGGSLPDRARRSPRRVRALFRRCAAVVTPSRYLQGAMQQYVTEKIRYIPNAIDLRRYRFVERDGAESKLVWLRAFSARYRPDVAIRTVAAIVNEWPGVELVMAGPDKGDGTLGACRELITELGLGDRVSIVGNVPKPDVPAFLQQGDILLNTTEAESFGVAVMEGAACGLCIVSSSVGELPFLWKGGLDALLVPSGDVEAFAGAVSRILSEADLAGSLSRNARSRAEEFSWSAVIPLWLKLFQEASCEQ